VLHTRAFWVGFVCGALTLAFLVTLMILFTAILEAT